MKKVGLEIKNIAEKIGLDRHLNLLKLQSEWENIVGPFLANETKLLCCKEKTLVVYVNNSVLLNEMVFMKKDLLKKMEFNNLLSKYNDLFFTLKLNSVSRYSQKKQKKKNDIMVKEKITIPDNIEKKIKKTASNIDDEIIKSKAEKIFKHAYINRQLVMKNDVFMNNVLEIMEIMKTDNKLSYFDLKKKNRKYSVNEYFFALYNRS